MRRDVEFTVEDGTTLRGFIHSPGGHPAPGIVMAHGFSGVKEQIDHYAAAFAAGGFSVLVFDHRGFGSSDGSPRLEVDALRQLRDWQDAISVAGTQAEFDAAAGVGVWGSSFAGGLAMVLAASDTRIRCIVAQIPHVSGHRNGVELFSRPQRRQLQQMLDADRTDRLAGAPPATVPVFATEPDQLCALPPAVPSRFVEQAITADPSWVNEVTLRSVEPLLTFEPAGWVPYISPTPFMMIVGLQDMCTFAHIQLAVYSTAHEPKQLVTHPGGHFDTYSTHFAQASEAALRWFTQHLKAAPHSRRWSPARASSST